MFDWGACSKTVRPPGQTATIHAHGNWSGRTSPAARVTANDSKAYARWLGGKKNNVTLHCHLNITQARQFIGGTSPTSRCKCAVARVQTWHLASVLTRHGTIKMPRRGQSSKWSLNIGSCIIRVFLNKFYWWAIHHRWLNLLRLSVHDRIRNRAGETCQLFSR